MKGKKWILVLAALAICLLAFVGCAKKDVRIEERKEEPPMEREKIVIKGKIGERVVVNPAFEWEGFSADSAFDVLIKDEAGATLLDAETTLPRWEATAILQSDTTYILSVTGKTSGATATQSFTTIAGTGSADLANAPLTVCDPYMDHMVLQRGKAITVRGETLPSVLVAVEFHGAVHYGVSDESGAYQITLPAMEADDIPALLEIRLPAGKKLQLRDVLVGDVYLFSGQSNMWWKLRDSDHDRTTDVDNAIEADIRYYSMKITKSSSPRENINGGKWATIDPSDNSYLDYSAIAFMTASMLGKALVEEGIPIGVIQSAEGDTNIVNWLSADYYDGAIGTKNINYNAMIYPLRHAEIAGVVWYQGCNNSGKSADYEALLGKLFANWRSLFRDETLPFYVVQLPCYDGDGGNNYDFSFVRESQLLACEADDHAYLIASCDGGDPTYIHPSEKRYIAERLTKSLLSTRYGGAYLPQGPTYLSHVIEGGSAVVTVKNGEGLTAQGEIVGFMLAGADGKYFDATATILGGKIIVTSDKVASPVYIKYGFSKSPFLNIYNKDGYLMSPFRTDDHNRNIDLLDYREDAAYTSHPDGSPIACEIVEEGGEIGLHLTKPNDGKSFGMLQLKKWGAVGCKEYALRFDLIGTNSGAEILFRIVEGSGEIWAISIRDDFVGREITLPTSAFSCVYNAQDGVIDYQAVMQVEITIRSEGEASLTVLGVRFVDAERTAPTSFSIRDAKNNGDLCTVKYGQSDFAESYRVIVSADGTDFTSPIFDKSTDQQQISFDAALCEEGTTYYVKVVAKNELGESVAENSGMILATLDRLVVASFDFADDASFKSFVSERMTAKSCLTLSRSEKGLRVNVQKKDGWAYCILTFDKGANVGYDTLKLHLDLTEYAGDYIAIQLQNEGGDTSYTYNFYSKAEGIFEIPLSSFKKDGVSFGGGEMGRIAFNLVDWNGGAEDNLYISAIEFLKK